MLLTTGIYKFSLCQHKEDANTGEMTTHKPVGKMGLDLGLKSPDFMVCAADPYLYTVILYFLLWGLNGNVLFQ